MVFVTLGTQDKPFTRLLKAVDKCIEEGIIKDKVIVQAGCTKYHSDNMIIFDLCSMDEFDNSLDECDLLITHGGVGSIVGGLNRKKKVIAVPRLARYGEHVNDHQKQIIKNFVDEGYILGASTYNELVEALKNVKKFEPNKYKSNNANMVKLVEKLIDE